MAIITLPVEDIWTKFRQVYPNNEHTWLYPSYQLGLRTVLVKGNSRIMVPLADPETVTAFNCGCLDAWELIQQRQESQKLEKSLNVSTSTKKPSRRTPSTKIEEYKPGF